MVAAQRRLLSLDTVLTYMQEYLGGHRSSVERMPRWEKKIQGVKRDRGYKEKSKGQMQVAERVPQGQTAT